MEFKIAGVSQDLLSLLGDTHLVFSEKQKIYNLLRPVIISSVNVFISTSKETQTNLSIFF